MKWLHISDIHFGAYTETDNERGKSKTMRTRFLEYLRKSSIKADELFISGDLGFGPEIADMCEEQRKSVSKKSADFILQVAKLIGIKDNDIISKVHIVPGNHDLIRSRNRTRCIKTFNQEYNEKRESEKEYFELCKEDIDVLSEGFQFFYMVLDELFGKAVMEKIKGEICHKIHRWVPLKSADLNLLCLNTAILAGLGKEGERDLDLCNLWIDVKRIEDVLLDIKKANKNPTIIIGHHDDSYLKLEERQRFRRCCQRNSVELILCGHAHVPGIDNGNRPRQLVSGCFKDTSGEEIASFFVGHYLERTQTVKFTTHVWEHDAWHPNNNRKPDPVVLLPILDDEDSDADLGFLPVESDSGGARYYSLAEATNKYVAHLKKQEATDALKYLREGLSDDSEKYGLTSQLFYERFYVKPPLEDDNRLFGKMNELFKDASHNMLCIKSTAGTGKTTLIRTLECRVEENPKRRKFRFQYHMLDCSINSGLHLFPFSDLHQRFRKAFSIMCRNSEWYNCFVTSLNYLVSDEALSSIDDVDLERFIGNIKLFRNNLYTGRGREKKPPIYHNHATQVNKAFEKIRAERVDSLALFMLTLVFACKKSSGVDKANVKNIIVFDNIETYTNSVATEVGRKFHNAIKLAEKGFGLLTSKKIVYASFKMDFTFVFCVRPVTNFSLFPRQEFGESFGPNDKYIYTWTFFDFTLEAMLKKLRFLKENAITNDFYFAVRGIIQIIVPEHVIEHYLVAEEFSANPEAADVHTFSERVLMPFFNNNYKNALMKIDSLDKEWLAKVLMYLNAPQFSALRPEARNMAHMILFKHIFDEFIQNKVFREFSISHILKGGNNHSFSRVLLAYIFWNTKGTWIGPSSSDTRSSITVRELIDAFPSKSSTVIKTLCSLSIYVKNKDDDKKYSAIREWGELIEIKGIKNALTIKSEISDADRQTDIEVSLSPIGECFILHVSAWFEYFSARLVHVGNLPLPFYNDFSSILLRNDNVIDEVIKALQKCAETLKKTVASCACEYAGQKRAAGECMAFVHRQELCLAIRSNIDYIDRFRRIHFCTHNDLDVNDKLLDKIKELNALYEFAKGTNKHPTRHCEIPKNTKYNPPHYHRKLSMTTEMFDECIDTIAAKMRQVPSCVHLGLYGLLEDCLLKRELFCEAAE